MSDPAAEPVRRTDQQLVREHPREISPQRAATLDAQRCPISHDCLAGHDVHPCRRGDPSFRRFIQQAFSWRWDATVAAVVNTFGFDLIHLDVHGIWRDVARLHLRFVPGAAMGVRWGLRVMYLRYAASAAVPCGL
jgi:hypothetical protein